MLAPTISTQVTERLSIGLGPTIDVFSMSLDPAFFAPDPGGGFLSANHGRAFSGAGFRAGVYYELNPCWSFGASYLSPQWFETFRWHTVDSTNTPRDVTLRHRLPAITSLGIAYRGFCRTVIAADVRYFDYAGAAPYGLMVPEGGVGWNSIFAVAFGVERQLGKRLKLRFGYLFSENPIPEVLTLFNTQLPGINQHQLSMGFSMQLTKAIAMDFAWIHGFENSITGPVPADQLPVGTNVTMRQSIDSWTFGLGVKY